MEKGQKIYEIGYLLSPLIAEEKLDEEISVLRKLIEEKGGFIISEGRPKSQKLAYPIKKFETAYFGWFKFSSDSETISEIKNSFEKSPLGEKIIRFLLIETKKETIAPISPKKAIRKKKLFVTPEAKVKGEIKLEEIDKKLEELLGKSE